jgi:hypothetical protein
MKWNPGYDVDALLGRLRLLRLKRSPDSELYMPVLVSAAKFDEKIPEAERLAIVRRSVASVLSQPSPDSRTLRAAITQEQTIYFRRPEREMVLLTSLSLMPRTKLRQRMLQGSKLQFSRSIPKAFGSSWLRQNSAHNEVPGHPNSYVKVRVALMARSTREAMERGFLALDFLRGIWNFALGFRRYRLTLIGVQDKPFNSILLGPQFSVHTKSGDLEEEELGIIGGFQEVAPVSDVDAVRILLARERNVQKMLNAIEHRKELELAFVRYARALDERDQDACFLGLWSLIERLTGTLDAKYDVTIRRTVSLFAPPEPQRSVLQHLREHRNGIAHSGRESELGEMLVSQAKGFVEELIDFHLAQGGHFESFDEACQFLEFPEDRARLKRQIDLRKLALNLRERSERRAANITPAEDV